MEALSEIQHTVSKHILWHVCGSQRQLERVGSLLMWVPGFKLGLSVLGLKVFVCRLSLSVFLYVGSMSLLGCGCGFLTGSVSHG